MAHELGHWINRDPWRVNQAHSFKMETDANARAVEILTRLGMSQEGSFMLMQKMLTSVPNKCAEAADLVSRFPAFHAVPREGC